MIHFIFCVHNHQPVGNFDYVLESAYLKAYEPFLRKLCLRPKIKLSFHISGYLLDWLSANKPGYVELLKEMVKRGQVEIMGGGYYEPILSVIPEDDRRGQLEMMREKLHELFGSRPKGIWLAERVWDPTLPWTLKDAGVEYVVVDDYHFVKSGVKRDSLFGYYVTEELGRVVKVFPGSERLRYLMPFERVEKFEEYMRGIDGRSNGVIVFADDGEKFGVWPGTDRWVFEEGWLDSFMDCLERNSDWIKPVTFSEYMELEEPLGRVYLPTTSYMEMGTWALPAEASAEYANLVEEVKTWKDDSSHYGERVLRFLQGGMWRNFFAKYPESNWMHKRMLMVSDGVREAFRGRVTTEEYSLARRHLYMAQCNDAYWHGVFGGLYLPHLRARVYKDLLIAENSSARPMPKEVIVKTLDIDADTHEEVLVSAEGFSLFFSPRRGAVLKEIDFKPLKLNLSNTLSRWLEGYHAKLKTAGEKGSKEETRSIHDLVATKEKGLDKFLKFDSIERGSLREFFFKDTTVIDDFSSSRYKELGDFYNGRFDFEIKKRGVIFTKKGNVNGNRLVIAKDVTVNDKNSFSIAYSLKNCDVREPARAGEPLSANMAVEFNLCFPGCNGPVCHYDFPQSHEVKQGLGSIGEEKGIKEIAMVDGFGGVRVVFSVNREVTLWRYPVETVSLSEAGFERIYQGSALAFLVPLKLPLEKTLEFSISLRFETF